MDLVGGAMNCILDLSNPFHTVDAKPIFLSEGRDDQRWLAG